jgi:hypothetical protein
MHTDRMVKDTGRDDVDQYWRRRAIVLAGVVGVVGLMAWGCSGGGDGDKGKETRRPVRNAGAVVTSGPPTALPTVTVTATKRVTATPKPSRRDGDACDKGEVVVDLAPSRASYGRRESPKFRFTVTNTGDRACTFDVGSRVLDLRIMSGSAAIWSSARCGSGTPSSIQMLRRGIPYVGGLTWDRTRAVDRCQGRGERARPGAYVASMRVPGVRVGKRPFRIG